MRVKALRKCGKIFASTEELTAFNILDYHDQFISSGRKMGIPLDVLNRIVQESMDFWSYTESIPTPENRYTFSIAIIEGTPTINIQVDRDEGPAMNKARLIKESIKGTSVNILPNAFAQSSYPHTRSKFAKHPNNDLAPGVSVGSGRFPCGSLGCIVKSGDQILGLTAAHVVDPNQSINDRAWIYSPAKPDLRNNQRTLRVGRLNNCIDLEPMAQSIRDAAGELTVNTLDVATFEIEFPTRRARNFHNQVPLDSNYTKVTSLQSIASANDIIELAIEPQKVFKTGRTTGFTSGLVFESNILEKQITLPNKSLYLYANLFSVKSDNPEQFFSDKGDSGAPVYTTDGLLLGFIVAAMGNFTLCCRAVEAMDEMGVTLY